MTVKKQDSLETTRTLLSQHQKKKPRKTDIC